MSFKIKKDQCALSYYKNNVELCLKPIITTNLDYSSNWYMSGINKSTIDTFTNTIEDTKGKITGKIEMDNLIEGMKRPKSQGTNITG